MNGKHIHMKNLLVLTGLLFCAGLLPSGVRAAPPPETTIRIKNCEALSYWFLAYNDTDTRLAYEYSSSGGCVAPGAVVTLKCTTPTCKIESFNIKRSNGINDIGWKCPDAPDCCYTGERGTFRQFSPGAGEQCFSSGSQLPIR